MERTGLTGNNAAETPPFLNYTLGANLGVTRHGPSLNYGLFIG